MSNIAYKATEALKKLKKPKTKSMRSKLNVKKMAVACQYKLVYMKFGPDSTGHHQRMPFAVHF